MTTLVSDLLSRLAYEVQETDTWDTGLWSADEIIAYINEISKEFVLKTQVLKLIDAVASVAGQRIYDQNSYTSQMDRIAFNNTATDRTTKFGLDRENPKWRTLSGIPRQYHQDQLPIKQFEVNRAPTSGQVGSGYTVSGLYGTVRQAMTGRSVTDAIINSASSLLASATANFTANDVGKDVVVVGAGTGGANLVSTIASLTTSALVTLAASASTTVSGVFASVGTLYGSSGNYGVLRYWYGTPAINGILPHGRPYAGTLRRMLSGVTNFEVMATRLVDEVENTSDLLRVPDYCVLYIKYGVLGIMLAKEGEAQDMTRAQYAKARYERGIKLFRRLMGVETEDAVIANG